MTDIRSALVGSPAAQSANGNRTAAANDGEQDGFDQALLGRAKAEDKPQDKRLDNEAPRDKRWLKLVERLATQGASEPDTETPADQDVPLADGEPSTLEPPLPDQPAKDTAKAEQPAETALPLVLALSELRKVASQPASTNAPAEENGELPGQAASRTAGTATPTTVSTSDQTAQHNAQAGMRLPDGMAATSGEELIANADPASGAPAEGRAAETDKPARQVPARQADSAGQQSRVSIISEQAMPAPAAGAGSTTATSLALDIASAAPRHAAAATAVQQLQTTATNAPSAHTLKIQLRPVELGTVNANLHLAGSQLTVEIEVENAEAYHRLSADREAITSALKGLGFDVDRITIQAPPTNNAASARTDASPPQTGSGGRDQQAFQSGGTGSDGANSGNRQTSRGAAGEEGGTRNISSSGPASSGGSLYI
ncbi:flagellar hook-length control protein FliK [Aminobacter sp. HY435]|uniref:flagellar hook-length control protein FliK n=1 Tax=Aminobacter sp. HY435 TaxID=2970917 RepID=UPI0022B9778D|nr:flagellar hook-length control protein FliK [Aminobacter sp. HY435]